MNYILITPARNEAANLPSLIDSVINQTKKPVLWLIMNDNSTDESEEIISEAVQTYDFISTIMLEPAEYDLAWRYHEIMSDGFKKAIEICRIQQLSWDYIGVLDGDIFFKDSNYYECLMRKLTEDESIGIISGGLLSYDGDSYKRELIDKNKPNGAARLMTLDCYNTIGYPIIPTSDSVMRIMANHYGYKTIRIEENCAYQSRATNAGRGEWKGGHYEGYVKYFLGYTLLYGLLNFVRHLQKGKVLRAFGFFLEFLKQMIVFAPKTDNMLVKDYFGKTVSRKQNSIL